MLKEVLAKLVEGQDLTEEEAEGAMNEVMSGEATPAQVAGFITALRMKGETVDEITACARIMRAKVSPVKVQAENVIDTCGTGGDCSHTFNISTAAALVVAAAGIPVAKHGNRSVSSKCGSADVLLSLGVKLDITPEKMGACIDTVGIGFLFAPLLHPAMKYAIGPRRELGIRTVFNILGPLTNPAGAKYQLLGVYDPALTEVMANVLGKLGSERVLIVHGSDGLDEITLTGPTHVSEFYNGEVKSYQLDPMDFGLNPASAESLHGGSPEENADLICSILKGKSGPQRDVVLMNASAALVVGGKAANWCEGAILAAEVIDSGAALKTLEQLVEFTNS